MIYSDTLVGKEGWMPVILIEDNEGVFLYVQSVLCSSFVLFCFIIFVTYIRFLDRSINLSIGEVFVTCNPCTYAVV
jgi:hypothetical protein